MSRSKERLLNDLYRAMKNLVEKMDEDTNKLLTEINAVKDNTDTRAEQILKLNNETKEDLLAQNDANTNRILAHLTSLEMKVNELKLNRRTCE